MRVEGATVLGHGPNASLAVRLPAAYRAAAREAALVFGIPAAHFSLAPVPSCAAARRARRDRAASARAAQEHGGLVRFSGGWELRDVSGRRPQGQERAAGRPDGACLFVYCCMFGGSSGPAFSGIDITGRDAYAHSFFGAT